MLQNGHVDTWGEICRFQHTASEGGDVHHQGDLTRILRELLRNAVDVDGGKIVEGHGLSRGLQSKNRREDKIDIKHQNTGND